jgi:aspartyl-tRNA(Asn)/glutamyl-tRNA(Gln) amidotransferase subunit C
MPDLIGQQTVLDVAKLARLELPADQLADYQTQLARVLTYVGQLNQLQLPPDTVPFFGAVEACNAIRPDLTTPSSPRDVILSNAPQTDGEYYLVPPVF